MENPVNAVKNAVPTFKWFLMFLMAFVILNAIIDVLSNAPIPYVPTVISFIMRPVSTMRALVSKKAP